RPDADVAPMSRLPEQLRATGAAKTPPRDRRGLVPAQRLRGKQPQVLTCAGGGRVEMAARAAAHGAVAVDDGPKGAVHLEPHSSAEAPAAHNHALRMLGYGRLRHINLSLNEPAAQTARAPSRQTPRRK